MSATDRHARVPNPVTRRLDVTACTEPATPRDVPASDAAMFPDLCERCRVALAATTEEATKPRHADPPAARRPVSKPMAPAKPAERGATLRARFSAIADGAARRVAILKLNLGDLRAIAGAADLDATGDRAAVLSRVLPALGITEQDKPVRRAAIKAAAEKRKGEKPALPELDALREALMVRTPEARSDFLHAQSTETLGAIAAHLHVSGAGDMPRSQLFTVLLALGVDAREAAALDVSGPGAAQDQAPAPTDHVSEEDERRAVDGMLGDTEAPERGEAIPGVDVVRDSEALIEEAHPAAAVAGAFATEAKETLQAGRKTARAAKAPRTAAPPKGKSGKSTVPPPVGTVIQKKDRAGTVRAECMIVDGGVQYAGTVYPSLFAAAKAANTALGNKGTPGMSAEQWWGLAAKPGAAKRAQDGKGKPTLADLLHALDGARNMYVMCQAERGTPEYLAAEDALIAARRVYDRAAARALA